MKIVVTGASGNVGAEVVRLLRQRPAIEVVAPARSGSVRFDFEDPSTFGVFDGAHAVFYMRPPQMGDARRFVPSIAAMQRAGVQRVVFLSLQGVERIRVVPHARIEALLVDSGLPYTFLRPSFFMQNLNTTHGDEIRQRGALAVPAGAGRTAFIDTRDIAAAAVTTLTTPGHERQAYTLTGSEALTYTEVAAILSDVMGRPIRYVSPSLVRFVRDWRQRGRSFDYILVMLGIYTTARFGLAAGLTDTLPTLIGRPPIRFRQYAEDYWGSATVSLR